MSLLISLFIGSIQSTLCQFTEYQHRHYSVNDGLLSNTIDDVISDELGIIYLASRHGINTFDGYRISTLYTNNQPHSVNKIHFKLDDKNRILVYGFNNVGIIDDHSIYFTSTIDEIKFENRLPDCLELIIPVHTKINDIHQSDDDFYVATSDGLIAISCLRPEVTKEYFANKIISSVYKDAESILWIAEQEGGLYSFPSLAIRRFGHSIGISDKTIQRIFTGAESVGFLDQDQIIHLIDKKYKPVGKYPVLDKPIQFPLQKLNNLGNYLNNINSPPQTIDNKQKYWIDQSSNTLWRELNGDNHQVNHQVLQDRKLQTLAVSPDSSLWIATDVGIIKVKQVDDHSQSWALFNATHGLPNAHIHDIIYWDDKLWIATSNGVYSTSIDDLQPNTKKPQVEIDQLRINGINRIDSTQSLNQLWHYEDDISFHYKAISNRKIFSGKPYYTYTLIRNGSDTISDRSDELSVSFTNLQHGKYEFYVEAGNDFEVKGRSSSIRFKILPHVFQTKFFYVLITVFLGLLLYLIIQYRINGIKTKEKEKTRLKEAQLAALRSQLNPHFVFNSLNSIQNYIFKNDPEMASEYLSKFSRLMRKSLEYTRLDKISLQEEVAFLENYLQLEQLRKNNGFVYYILIEEGITPSELMINPLLSQPIIENSIKHAFKEMDEGGIIDIHYAMIRGNILKMSIKDNGRGMKSERPSQEGSHTSVGMQLIKDRLALINSGKKDLPAQLEVTSDKNGTEVTILIPVDTQS